MTDGTEAPQRTAEYLNALPGERSVDANGCIDYAIEVQPDGKHVRHDLVEGDLRSVSHPGVTVELEHAQATLARVADVLAQLRARVETARPYTLREQGFDIAASMLATALQDAPQPTARAPLHYTLDGDDSVCGATSRPGPCRLAFDPSDTEIDCPGCRLFLAGARAGKGGE
jgi:hypothetical protein